MTNIITSIREKFNIDQTQISIDCGLSRGYINKVEKGKLKISDASLQILRDVYGEIVLEKTQIEQNSKKDFTQNEKITQDFKDGKINVQKEKIVGVNETSVHSIIETNRNISRTLEKMVDTNAQFAQLLESIISPKKDTYQGLPQEILTKLSQILEYVVEVGAGKRWETKEDGYVELNRRFYENPTTSKEMDSQNVKGK